MTGTPLRKTLFQVDQFYTSAKQVKRRRHQVDAPALRRVHRDIRLLGILIENDQQEENCGPLLQSLRRFSFLSASTPLPFDHPLLWSPAAAETLADAVARYPRLYPNFAEVAKRIDEGMTALRAHPASPLWDWLAAHVPRHAEQDFWLRRSSDQTLVLADPRMVAEVRTLVEAQALNLRVGPALAFQGEQMVSGQIFMGTSRWYPEWCFTAPRALQIDLVQYHGVWDDAEYPATFPFNRRSLPKIGFEEVLEAEVALPTATTSENADNPVEEPVVIAVPVLDWQRLLNHTRQEFGGEDADAPGAVPARLHVLQGFVGVWLGCSEDETVLGLDLESETPGNRRVERLKVDELEPGDCLLLRTEGAGDLLGTLADQLLGGEGAPTRELHREWKKSVRQHVFRQMTLERAVQRLRDLGAVKASVENLRRWETDDNLRPQRDEDFRALVVFCGMEERLDEIAQAVDRLRFVQHSAGHHISRMILDVVAAADLGPLEREGMQEFTLPASEGGGTFTAYRLLAASEQVDWVSPRQLGRPISLEDQEGK